MKKLQIKFPVVRFKTIEVEVSDDKASDLCDHYRDRDTFIEDQITEQCPDELDWLAMPIHKAIDNEFATIKRI